MCDLSFFHFRCLKKNPLSVIHEFITIICIWTLQMGRSQKSVAELELPHTGSLSFTCNKSERPCCAARWQFAQSWGDTGLTAAVVRLLAPHLGLSLFLLPSPAAFTHYLCSRTTAHTWIQCSGSNPAGHDSCGTSPVPSESTVRAQMKQLRSEWDSLCLQIGTRVFPPNCALFFLRILTFS